MCPSVVYVLSVALHSMSDGPPLYVAMHPVATSGNPYTGLLAAALRGLGVTVAARTPTAAHVGRYAVIHLHWPEYLLEGRTLGRTAIKSVSVVMALIFHKMRGHRIVWTAHNGIPHGWRQAPPRLAPAMLRVVMRLVDGVVHLSEAGRSEAERQYPGLTRRPFVVVPLGDISKAYGPVDGVLARERFGASAEEPVILAFGHMRRYRRIDALVSAFSALPAGLRAQLHIVGPCNDPEFANELSALRDATQGVYLDLRMQDDQALAEMISAADLVVQPFEVIVHSASINLALGLGTSVIAPRSGSLPEQERALKSGMLSLYDGELDSSSLLEAVRASMARETNSEPALSAEDLGLGDWQLIAAAHVSLYRLILAAP